MIQRSITFKVISLGAFALATVLPVDQKALAHQGRVYADGLLAGCHNDTSTGVPHCHTNYRAPGYAQSGAIQQMAAIDQAECYPTGYRPSWLGTSLSGISLFLVECVPSYEGFAFVLVGCEPLEPYCEVLNGYY